MQRDSPRTALSTAQPQCDSTGRLIYLQVEVPVGWHEPVLRHHEHLVDLALALQKAGVSEEDVIVQLNEAIESYRRALLRTIQKNRQSNDI